MAKGIYKRGGIYWIRYAGLDGKTIYESSQSDKFRDAETLIIKRRQTIKDGKQPEIKKKIPNTTFKELAVEYLKWAERQKAFRQKGLLVNQLIGIFGGYPLRYFNTKQLEQYQTDRLQKGNASATVNRHIATMKHMLRKAVEWDLVEDEALKRIKRVKLLPEHNRRLRYLSKEECQALLVACDELSEKNLHYAHLKPIVITALNTGMRKSEILNLKWDNVDLRHGFILLSDTKNGDRREIPINGTLRATLEVLPRRLDGGYVFFDHITDKAYRDVKRSFNTVLKRVGVKDFHFHDLRHTFASHLVMAGVDLTTVSRLLGHKDLTMTLRYSHLSPLHMAKAVDILDETLNGNVYYTKTIQLR